MMALEQQMNQELDQVTLLYRSGNISTNEAQERMLKIQEKYDDIRRKVKNIG